MTTHCSKGETRLSFDKNSWQKTYREQNKNKCTKKYEKTKSGFLMRTYRNMKSRVTGIQKKKAHLYQGLSLLNKFDFYTWSAADHMFHLLFESWEQSGYCRKLTPSIDRIDSTIGYQIGNIQWITHSENSKKGNKNRWQKQLL